MPRFSGHLSPLLPSPEFAPALCAARIGRKQLRHRDPDGHRPTGCPQTAGYDATLSNGHMAGRAWYREPCRHDRPSVPPRNFSAKPTLRKLREAAEHCTGCDICIEMRRKPCSAKASLTQRYSCRGTARRSGRSPRQSLVGPAGRILDKALAEAGIARHEVYVTNAVKHFKWEPQGKRRKHKRPSAGEIAACRPWLESELHAIRPRILVCLGATAAQSVFGKMVRIQDVRGRFAETPWAPQPL